MWILQNGVQTSGTRNHASRLKKLDVSVIINLIKPVSPQSTILWTPSAKGFLWPSVQLPSTPLVLKETVPTGTETSRSVTCCIYCSLRKGLLQSSNRGLTCRITDVRCSIAFPKTFTLLSRAASLCKIQTCYSIPAASIRHYMSGKYFFVHSEGFSGRRSTGKEFWEELIASYVWRTAAWYGSEEN